MKKSSIIMLVGGLIFALGFALTFANVNSFMTERNTIYVPPGGADSPPFASSLRAVVPSDVSWETITRHYTPSSGIDDWRKLHPPRHWKKGYSAYEMAQSWERANPELPTEINALFGGSAELLVAIPEYKTPLPGGRTASQSDALAFIRVNGKVCAAAVEGKADETFGPTVGDWLVNASPGKIERLKYITDKLGLPYPPAGDIRYQLLHRTASAVIEAERFNANCASMVVHSFAPNKENYDDYKTFLRSFGIHSVRTKNLYETNKASVPLSFGWTFPKQGGSPAGPTATQKFSINIPTIMMLAGGLVLIVGLGVGLASTVSKPRIVHAKNVKMSDDGPVIIGAVDKTIKQINKEEGDRFERYVLRKFRKRDFSIVAASDKSVDGVFTDDTNDPDFKITLKINCKFAVEAKFRKGFAKNVIKCTNSDEQLQRYKNYQHSENQKTFIVMGVGEPADDPQDIYIIPVDELPTSKMHRKHLDVYKQQHKGDFVYNEKKGILSMMRPL